MVSALARKRFDKDIELAKIQARIAYTQGAMFTGVSILISVILTLDAVSLALGNSAYSILALIMGFVFVVLVVLYTRIVSLSLKKFEKQLDGLYEKLD